MKPIPDSDERSPIGCKSCGAVILDRTPYWDCPPLGSVCDSCWPTQHKNHLREYRNPKPPKEGST